MRIPRDHAFAVVDPDLPSAYAVEGRRGGVAERESLVEGDLLLLACPVEEACVDASHGPARRREHGRSVRSGEVDPFMDAAAIVARRTREEIRIAGDLSTFDGQRERAPQPNV